MSIDQQGHCNRHDNLSGSYYSDNVWAIFNHIYDVHTGVLIGQQMHCGGGAKAMPMAGRRRSRPLP